LPDKREAQAESPPIGQDIKENTLSPVLSQRVLKKSLVTCFIGLFSCKNLSGQGTFSTLSSQVLVPVQNLWYIITWTREKMIISASAKT
jgi:hypothetical protein